MKKETILNEIKRIAAQNGGIAPGSTRFEKETGIRSHEWEGKFWARWSDAVTEAGLSPNQKQEKFESDFVLEKLAQACLHFGKFPTRAELKLYRANVDSSLPHPDIITRTFGTKDKKVAVLLEFASRKDEFSEIAKIVQHSVVEEQEAEVASHEGHVYLIKWGEHYKIGRTENIERRFKEIRTNLPSKGEIVHTIRTDDPAGIEAYWHKRFADRRAENGEWFNLSPTEVKVFRKRKFM